MKEWILKSSLMAHMYLKLAIGRTIHLTWEIGRRISTGRRTEQYVSKQEEPLLWLHNRKLQRIEIKSREGFTLTGHLLEHPEAERVVLLFHGWRGRWDRDGAVFAKGLYERKCSVLLAEQRAHQASGGKYIGFGVLERYDCLDWLRYLTGHFPELPVYLSGVSMGASTVLMASGLELPMQVKGIIADCGFTTPYEMVCVFAKNYLNIEGNSMVDAVNSLCRKKAGYDLKEYSTLEAMKCCKVPVFFAHGTGDHFVPYEMTLQNYEACASDKRLFTAEGASHTRSYLSDPKRYMEELADFFHWRRLLSNENMLK